MSEKKILPRIPESHPLSSRIDSEAFEREFDRLTPEEKKRRLESVTEAFRGTSGLNLEKVLTHLVEPELIVKETRSSENKTTPFYKADIQLPFSYKRLYIRINPNMEKIEYRVKTGKEKWRIFENTSSDFEYLFNFAFSKANTVYYRSLFQSEISDLINKLTLQASLFFKLLEGNK